MNNAVSQSILDSLTDIEMPKQWLEHRAENEVSLNGIQIPVHRCDALVLGSGAAGLRAAVELRRRSVNVIVATQTLFWGTSACSGSDKQTLHTASTSFKGDDFTKLAAALGAGGAMDQDTAYVEAVGSIDAFSGLKFLGLPLPEDRFGAVLRYQTDHDEAGRATSCGPRTSRLMVKVLAEEAVSLGIPFVDRCSGVRLLTSGDGERRKIAGLVAIKTDARTEINPYGLVVFQCPAVVLATGGPGELYRDSVYPSHCFGSLGLALEAGIELVNLTESQFGIGTRRDEFPWNLSGTYVQAMPYIYSVDKNGKEYNFLADYYRSTQELASNIFRKGYQWPFHASRMVAFGSSLLDLAIFREAQAGRVVHMDFNRNPLPVPGDLPFSLDRLDADVQAYLKNNEALQEQPIDRLRKMNPLSIELYKRYKRDLTKDPLPFNVNNQHMNGGIAVDIWAQSNLSGCYAIGEVAGTHGVTRPGGAALNAGQVFGVRCAKHIRANCDEWKSVGGDKLDLAQIAGCILEIEKNLSSASDLTAPKVKMEVQARMSDKAGFICQADEVRDALEQARALNLRIRDQGLSAPNAAQVVNAVLWKQMALTSEAIFLALSHYIEKGGGSRGARALCSPQGNAVPDTRLGALHDYRFLAERDEDKHQQIRVRLLDGELAVLEAPLRTLEGVDSIFFEKNWPDFLTGGIFKP